MKTVFKSVMLVLAICGMGAVTTSCDSDTIQQIIALIFNTGQTYTYQGTATSQALTGSHTPAASGTTSMTTRQATSRT